MSWSQSQESYFTFLLNIDTTASDGQIELIIILGQITCDKAKNLRMNNNDVDIMNRINKLNNKNVNNKMNKKRRKLLAQLQCCRALQACIKQACHRSGRVQKKVRWMGSLWASFSVCAISLLKKHIFVFASYVLASNVSSNPRLLAIIFLYLQTDRE